MDTIELLAEISVLKEKLKKSVEVVRCKDCKYYETDDLCGNAGVCKSTGLVVVYDWFCADGERDNVE